MNVDDELVRPMRCDPRQRITVRPARHRPRDNVLQPPSRVADRRASYTRVTYVGLAPPPPPPVPPPPDGGVELVVAVRQKRR